MTKRMNQSLNARRKTKRHGFTLIELLVVISIITLLVGILTPGIRIFKKASDGLKQKSRFHAMEIGLELFQKDYTEYPESNPLGDSSNGYVYGAQHLAEALAGRDKKGFDPKTDWYAPLNDEELYSNSDDDQIIKKSLARRRGPYIDLNDADIYEPAQLYDSLGNMYSGDPPDYDSSPPSPVFTDVFYKKKITTIITDSSGNQEEVKVRVGTPVLYFKAKSSSRYFRENEDDPATSFDETDETRWIYNYDDNYGLFQLEVIKDPAEMHRYNESYTYPDGRPPREHFYEDITNPNVESNDPDYYRPYNARTFILMSAGWDGIFGTNDDITSFNY